MKKLHSALIITAIIAFTSCAKEYSLENGGSNPNIIGPDCRMSMIGYSDSTSGIGTGSVAAVINSGDSLTSVMDYDSISNSINFFSTPVYVNDTVYIDADEYFVQTGTSNLVTKLHGLLDPTNPSSPAIDINYTYDAGGYLVKKQYSFSAFPGVPYEQVDYNYSGGNMTGMTHTNLITGDLVTDAVVTYTRLTPRNYIYVFPDELTYQYFTQFLNFGTKNTNAVSSITVNTYDPGNVITNTSLSIFSKYILSVDNYVLSCVMGGSDQPAIPAVTGKLSFSYHCK
ncbi:MAG: hypothetical protein ABJA78_14165 [Ferruginibacter sp.]